MSSTRKISSNSSRKNKRWDPGDMAKAIEIVREKKMGWMKISKAFNVPCGTLRRLANEGYSDPDEAANRRSGRPPFLSKALEDELVQHCLRMEASSTPFSKQDLREMASDMAKRNGISHSSPNFKVGKKWLRLFLNRHPELKFTRQTQVSVRRRDRVNKNNEDGFFEAMDFVSVEQYSPEVDNRASDCDGSEAEIKVEVLQPPGNESNNECIDAVDQNCRSGSRACLNSQEMIQPNIHISCQIPRTKVRRNHIEYIDVKDEQVDLDEELVCNPLQSNDCPDTDVGNSEEQVADPDNDEEYVEASSQNHSKDTVRILPKLKIRSDLKENRETHQSLLRETKNVDLKNLVPCINLGQVKFFKDDVPKEKDDIVCMILSDKSSIATPHIEMNLVNVESHNVGRSTTGEVCIANCLQASGQQVIVVAVHISQNATIGEAVSFVHDALILYTIAGAQARKKNTHLRPMILGGEFNIDFGSKAALPLLNFLKQDLNLTINRVARRDNAPNLDTIIGTTFSRHLKDLRPPIYVSYSRHWSKE